jgi:hypothetical protein
MAFAILTSLLLLAPVLICNGINNMTFRIIVIIVSNVVLQTILSSLAKSTTIELFIAGAT